MLRGLGSKVFHDGNPEVFFRSEKMIEGALRDPGSGQNLIQPHRVVTLPNDGLCTAGNDFFSCSHFHAWNNRPVVSICQSINSSLNVSQFVEGVVSLLTSLNLSGSLNLSQFVARKNWLRCSVSPFRCR